MGGNNAKIQIESDSLDLQKEPFDSGLTCRVYRGQFRCNGRVIGVACKQFVVKIAGKHKRRQERELQCLSKLRHRNIACHLGIDLQRSLVVTEFLKKEIETEDGKIEKVNNARQLLDSLKSNLSWSDRITIVGQACA